MPYVAPVREWWETIDIHEYADTGVYGLAGPPGLNVRFTRTAIRSPIRGIQAFPFVTAACLQLMGIQGGSTKMLNRVCLDNRFTIDEFTIICKSNLPSTFQQGQILAFVPTDILNGSNAIGRWLYFRPNEILALANGIVLPTVLNKAQLKI
jgi:hypothetical protein